LGHRAEQAFEGAADVLVHRLETARRAAAVAHAAVIESQRSDAASRKLAREQGELAVAARSILGTADHDEHAAHAGRIRQRQHAYQRLAAAAEDQRLLLHASAISVASSSAGHSLISIVDQNASPATDAARTSKPCARQSSTTRREPGRTAAAASAATSIQSMRLAAGRSAASCTRSSAAARCG